MEKIRSGRLDCIKYLLLVLGLVLIFKYWGEWVIIVLEGKLNSFM